MSFEDDDLLIRKFPITALAGKLTLQWRRTGGGGGAGAREKRGGKREERGREAGSLRWQEQGKDE